MFYEKKLVEKAATIKKFEYSPLDSELKKQYRGLSKLFKSDEKEEPVTIKKEKPAINGESKLIYDSRYSFSDYSNIRKYYALPFLTKYYRLLSFYLNEFRIYLNELNEFRNLVPRTEKTKNKKNGV